MQQQQRATHYWTKGGVPILGDPFVRLAEAASAVRASRTLAFELGRPEAQRARATRSLRLAAAGVIDAAATAAAWKGLIAPLLEEALRSSLGRMSCTNEELVASDACGDGGAIKRITALGIRGRPCPLCPSGCDSRAHAMHECGASQPAIEQAQLMKAGVMATWGRTFWFDLSSVERNRIGAAYAAAPSAHVQVGDGHQLTQERMGCLAAVYAGDARLFNATMAAVAVQAAQLPRLASLSLVAQVPLELRAWVRDVFGVRGEAMASSLTFSTNFAEPPFVLGDAWAGGEQGLGAWRVGVDNPRATDWSATPWPHSVMLTVNEHSDGALARVWVKAKATARAGHRVVIFVQEAHSRSRQHYQNMGAVALAFIPKGTIPLGHACGWNDDASREKDRSHSWSCGTYGALRPPSECAVGQLRRHSRIMNARDVRLLLFSPFASNVARGVSHGAIARLAYVLGGVGGLGEPSSRWGPMWYGAGSAKSLAWSAQRADSHGFMRPWQIAMWQASPRVAPLELEKGACGERDSEAVQAMARLRHSASWSASSDNAIAAGQVPSALPDFASALGVSPTERRAAMSAVVHAELVGVRGGAKQRALQVTHHWQLVGVPLEELGAVRYPVLAACHKCQMQCRHLYRVFSADSDAAAGIVDHVCSRAIDAVQQRISGGGAERAERVLRSALAERGACVCFECAVPALTAAYVARRDAQHGDPPTAPAPMANGGRLGRGARERIQTVRYVPPNEQAVAAQRAAADAAYLADQQAAVTAELRAIGIQPDERYTLLRRVPARVAHELCSGTRGEAASIAGQAFTESDSLWIVADVAPSSAAADGHTVAYVFDARVRISVGAC